MNIALMHTLKEWIVQIPLSLGVLMIVLVHVTKG